MCLALLSNRSNKCHYHQNCTDHQCNKLSPQCKQDQDENWKIDEATSRHWPSYWWASGEVWKPTAHNALNRQKPHLLPLSLKVDSVLKPRYKRFHPCLEGPALHKVSAHIKLTAASFTQSICIVIQSELVWAVGCWCRRAQRTQAAQ